MIRITSTTKVLNVTGQLQKPKMRMLLMIFALNFSVLSMADNYTANGSEHNKSETKPLEKSRFEMLKQSKDGISHGSKCGTSDTKCNGGTSHGSKCGSCNPKR
ncbi:hypothetical protein [Sulfurovum sp. NBC37-1]|uniref:hypothetical protein n=1 Tax=Sulfurovum sp. (strain NBC37-1) TaxID=387093 RepID=UPI0001587901|nr:hypothetical protein [Sulfurovum sp. NBC37-1]BAF71728.1 hypothetical protein SUN_0770 [Sulfurovum sp. NBC37-1]